MNNQANLSSWKEFLRKLKNPTDTVNIAVVGKYVELKDAYKSINEALIHGATANNVKAVVHWIHSEQVEPENIAEVLKKMNGILVAPGFGSRGIEGKIAAIKYARENNIPFLGICLGMQCSVIEFARNVLGYESAHTVEIDANTAYPVIDMMNEQKNISDMGGTMRLGAYACQLKKGSKISEA